MSDPVQALREHGYPTSHRAAEIAMGRSDSRILQDLGVPAARIRLMRSFDPRSAAHPLDVEDPYYGSLEDHEETFAVIDASLPGLHDRVDERGVAS